MTQKTSFWLGAFLVIACLVVLHNLKQPSSNTETIATPPVAATSVVAAPKPAPETPVSVTPTAPTNKVEETKSPATAPPSAAAQGSIIKGRVSLKTAPPAAKTISMAADAACAALHSTSVTTRHYVVGANGSLANVFVSVTEGLTGQTFPPAKKPFVLDQKGCLYFPYVFCLQTGQELEIVNSDATLHNVHIIPNNNPELNKGMPVQGMKFTLKFANPEVEAPVQFKCDVHPWMFAYAFVLPHPFFASTGEDGSFQLQGLPAGTYTIQAWHQKAGKLTQSVTVGLNETKEIAFEFNVP